VTSGIRTVEGYRPTLWDVAKGSGTLIVENEVLKHAVLWRKGV
jgi:hypothetical protein